MTATTSGSSSSGASAARIDPPIGSDQPSHRLVLPRPVGWLAIATLVGIVALAVIGMLTQGPPLWIAGVGLLIAMAAWLAALATALGS